MKNSEFNKILCTRIKYLRLQHNLTIEQLAYQSGISKGGLSEIERGMKEPRNLTILKICIALDITLYDFFNFKEINDFIETLK
ncbi:MAG: helix-turn-helix transcriptional regulator [Candidatus Gastranaerophilales bacterium]|nr:helix-turn-helix transcriptional regulator [Candidatus Gastranaerophilales bacterium]